MKRRKIILASVVPLLPASCPLCSHLHLRHPQNHTYQQYRWVTDTSKKCGLFIGYFCLLAFGCKNATGYWTRVTSNGSARKLNDGSGTGWFQPSLSTPSYRHFPPPPQPAFSMGPTAHEMSPNILFHAQRTCESSVHVHHQIPVRYSSRCRGSVGDVNVRESLRSEQLCYNNDATLSLCVIQMFLYCPMRFIKIWVLAKY